MTILPARGGSPAVVAVGLVVRRCCAFSSSSASAGGAGFERHQRPNRLTEIYSVMRTKDGCPEAVEAYAACVEASQKRDDDEGDDPVHRACQKEFDAVLQCYARTRQRLREPLNASGGP